MDRALDLKSTLTLTYSFSMISEMNRKSNQKLIELNTQIKKGLGKSIVLGANFEENSIRDHPFKTSACIRGVGVSPIADVCRC